MTINKLILMSIRKGRTPRIANKIVEKNKARELPLVDFNIYYKITENETDHCGTKQINGTGQTAQKQIHTNTST